MKAPTAEDRMKWLSDPKNFKRVFQPYGKSPDWYIGTAPGGFRSLGDAVDAAIMAGRNK